MSAAGFKFEKLYIWYTKVEKYINTLRKLFVGLTFILQCFSTSVYHIYQCIYFSHLNLAAFMVT